MNTSALELGVSAAGGAAAGALPGSPSAQSGALRRG